MRSGWFAAGVLCAALGFALGFAPARARLLALAVLVAVAVAVSFAPIPTAWADGMFLGCWLSVVVAAASVNLPGGIGRRLALALAVDAGLWSGAVIAVAPSAVAPSAVAPSAVVSGAVVSGAVAPNGLGPGLDLARALPWVLLCLPAAWMVGRRWQLAVKVAAGWLIAVALLSASLQLVVHTPGYKPDHME